MAHKEKLATLFGNKRFGYRVAPLLFLLLGILLVNLFATNPQPEQIVTIVETAVATQVPSATRQPILQATILPSPTPTATSRPLLPDNAAINLIGPPPGSSFPSDGRITFYWQLANPIQSGQQIVLALRQNDREQIVASLDQANFGDGYQVSVNLRDVDILPGTAVWQLHLEWAEDQQRLLSSEARDLTIQNE